MKFSEALEQIESADRRGFDSVWVVEQRFFEECSHSSAPELFLAAGEDVSERLA